LNLLRYKPWLAVELHHLARVWLFSHQRETLASDPFSTNTRTFIPNQNFIHWYSVVVGVILKSVSDGGGFSRDMIGESRRIRYHDAQVRQIFVVCCLRFVDVPAVVRINGYMTDNFPCFLCQLFAYGCAVCTLGLSFIPACMCTNSVCADSNFVSNRSLYHCKTEGHGNC
jgi:hypothetical protein